MSVLIGTVAVAGLFVVFGVLHGKFNRTVDCNACGRHGSETCRICGGDTDKWS